MKRCSIVVFLFSGIFFQGTAQNGMWTCLRNGAASFGTQGVSSVNNNPPKLTYSSYWTDSTGKFWLFGGLTNAGPTYYNTLWRFDPDINEWTWINGSNIPNDSGNCGIQGVPSQSNYPSARRGSSCWNDNQGNLWLFGGLAFNGFRGDMWRYHIATNEWTWMKGNITGFSPPFYGIKGVEDSLNTPGRRYEASSNWVDSAGNLWLFGGGPGQGGGTLRDVWRYNTITNNWTWMAGDSIEDQMPQSIWNPGCRTGANGWTDASGKFYLFGGLLYYWVGSWPNQATFGDVWRFDPATLQWTWMPGVSENYSVFCTSPVTNPRARADAGAAADHCGNLWIVSGGTQFNAWDGYFQSYVSDVWMYNLSALQWGLMKGTPLFTTGYYNTIGVPDTANHPESRYGAAMWISKSNEVYIFGGVWEDGNWNFYLFNDLWRFTQDSICTGCFVTAGITTPADPSAISIYPNPSGTFFTLSYPSGKEAPETVSIYDATGRSMLEVHIDPSKNSLQFGSSFSPGVYYVAARFKDRIKTLKIIRL